MRKIINIALLALALVSFTCKQDKKSLPKEIFNTWVAWHDKDHDHIRAFHPQDNHKGGRFHGNFTFYEGGKFQAIRLDKGDKPHVHLGSWKNSGKTISIDFTEEDQKDYKVEMISVSKEKLELKYLP